jgi:hypothetical protein
MKIRQIIIKSLLLIGSLFLSMSTFAQPPDPSDSAPLDSDLLLPLILTTAFISFLVNRNRRKKRKEV